MIIKKPEKFRACIYPDDELVYDAEDIDAFLEVQASRLEKAHYSDIALSVARALRRKAKEKGARE